VSAKPVTPTKPAKPAAAKTTVKKAKTSSKAAKTKSSKASPPLSAKAKAAAHVAHVKHEQHLAHEAHLKAEGKVVALAIGDALPVCAFEAVAASLRLLGARVHGDDVGELWHLLGEPEAAPVGEALAAAALFGLAGYRPVATAGDDLGSLAWHEGDPSELDFGHVNGRHESNDGGLQCHRQSGDFVRLDRACFPFDLAHGLRVPVIEAEPAHALASLLLGDVEASAGGPDVRSENTRIVRHELERSTGHLILSVDVPGPHAVLATADGWWSWGELYDPWPCRVSDAWAVSW
jgi:hypothetical protein